VAASTDKLQSHVTASTDKLQSHETASTDKLQSHVTASTDKLQSHVTASIDKFAKMMRYFTFALQIQWNNDFTISPYICRCDNGWTDKKLEIFYLIDHRSLQSFWTLYWLVFHTSFNLTIKRDGLIMMKI
jgi:hypothetical protein